MIEYKVTKDSALGPLEVRFYRDGTVVGSISGHQGVKYVDGGDDIHYMSNYHLHSYAMGFYHTEYVGKGQYALDCARKCIEDMQCRLEEHFNLPMKTFTVKGHYVIPVQMKVKARTAHEAGRKHLPLRLTQDTSVTIGGQKSSATRAVLSIGALEGEHEVVSVEVTSSPSFHSGDMRNIY